MCYADATGVSAESSVWAIWTSPPSGMGTSAPFTAKRYDARNLYAEQRTYQDHEFSECKQGRSILFPETFCTFIMKDEEGCYWVTTHNDGVLLFNKPRFPLPVERAALAVKDIVLCGDTGASIRTHWARALRKSDIMEINCHDLGTKFISAVDLEK